jgi:hypothetical protein
MVAGVVVLKANRRAEAQQNEQQEAAEADGKEPFGERHAALARAITLQSADADNSPPVTSSARNASSGGHSAPGLFN